ncbi:hypothetical protein CK203_115375 [Vitis vinifera]|uniref:Uncharacterized protein n=1 Tax=Vitis vinifera TaxID=29760 RepID=A0A438D1J9_VITVI|nr:hypothetical protein CK203_115375 [Vitis vinifera]
MIINTPVSGQRLVPIKVAAMTSRALHPSTSMSTFQNERTRIWDKSLIWLDSNLWSWKRFALGNLSRIFCLLRSSKDQSLARLHHLGMEEIDIKDLITMKSVPPDAKAVGPRLSLTTTK